MASIGIGFGIENPRFPSIGIGIGIDFLSIESIGIGIGIDFGPVRGIGIGIGLAKLVLSVSDKYEIEWQFVAKFGNISVAVLG